MRNEFLLQSNLWMLNLWREIVSWKNKLTLFSVLNGQWMKAMLSFFVQRRMYELWYIIMRNYFCKTWSKCWRQFHRPLQISDRVLHRQSECTCPVVRKERLRINIKKTQIWADAVSRQDSRVNTKYKMSQKKAVSFVFSLHSTHVL